MSNPRIYLMYYDAHRDTGDFGGDIHRAMDEVGDLLDEQGVRVTKSGKVYAEKSPEPVLKSPEHRIYAKREVQVYAEGVSGKDNPTPIRTEMRNVPVKCIPMPALLPNEKPELDTLFNRALVTAKFAVTRGRIFEGTKCPFSGTLSMLWFGIKSEARKRKMDLDEDQLDDTLRMIQRAIPEANQASYPLFQHFMQRITGGKCFHEAMDCLQADFTFAANEMHSLRDFTEAREIQLESVAFAMGVRPDELVSCDLEGNVIGGTGAFLTDRKRWTDGSDDGEKGELYADYHSPHKMNEAIEEQVSIDAFNGIGTGAGSLDHQLIFDPKYLIQKPLEREFSVDVPTYALFFWPKGQSANVDNLIRIDAVGWWMDVKRNIVSQYPKDKWEMDVECGDKTPITTSEPVYRRPSWHLGCSNLKCKGISYVFEGKAASELIELAGLAAKSDDWMHSEEQSVQEYKEETEVRLGMPLIDFLNVNARTECCMICGEHMVYVNPTKTFKVHGEEITVPEMTICRNHAWWNKPRIMDNWDQLIKMYGGDKKKAAERMETVTLHDGIKYAEQVGETTYTWNLDWLQQEDQHEVRKLRETLSHQNLLSQDMFTYLRDGINKQFTKKQCRFLIDQLYSERATQQWAAIEESEFVDALRRKLSFVTMDKFHAAYGLVAQLLMTNPKLSYPEKNYGWALLNGLKAEFNLIAETAVIQGKCDEYNKWNEGLKLISFRHLSLVQTRCRSLKTTSESMFLIREALKVARRRLTALARTTSWIKTQEDYLYSVEAGDIRADQERIDDIMAASRLAKSAHHLANRASEALRV